MNRGRSHEDLPIERHTDEPLDVRLRTPSALGDDGRRSRPCEPSSGRRREGVRAGGVTLLLCAIVLAPLPFGCGSNGEPSPLGTQKANPPSSTGGGCDGLPEPGCPCSQPGAVGDCGEVLAKSDDFTQCSMGTTTCSGGSWGPCVGGLTLKALGGSPCGSSNPCDPYCYNAVGDGGETIATTACFPATCNEAAGPFSTVYGNLPASLQQNLSPCTSGSPSTADNCQFDTVCSGGSCTPYSSGQTNPAPTCATLPDFTVGAGCCDYTVNPNCTTYSLNGTTNGYDIEVCNRGGAAASSGTLVVAIDSATSASPASPSGCTTGETTSSPYPGAAFATGPQLPSSGSSAGYCAINLATTPIQAGSCMSLNVASNCAAMGGGSLDNMSGDHILVVNPSGSMFNPAPGPATPLPECDTCNDFAAFSNTDASLAAFKCSSSTCGCTSGTGSAEGGAPCTTTVSGYVYDPGANVVLPNITVYQPTGALTALPDGVACDTCSSLLSPNLGTALTDVNGHFKLQVTPVAGVASIVMQSGRWRREITVTGITSCTDNPQPTCTASASYSCQTRLPQTAAEGNIPLTALSMGNKEPFECDFARFLGGITTSVKTAVTIPLAPLTATLSVGSTTGFYPGSLTSPGTLTIYPTSGAPQTVTYTGTTATSFTGCSQTASALGLSVATSAIVGNPPLAQMAPPSATAGVPRIQLFNDESAASYSSPSPPSVTTLYATAAELEKYTAILLPCPGTSSNLDGNLTSADEQNFISYAKAGGKLFIDHDAADQTLQTPHCTNTCEAATPFSTVSTWTSGSTTPNCTQAQVLGTDSNATLFKQWLINVGAYTSKPALASGGYLNTPDPRWRATNPVTTSSPPLAYEWLRGDNEASTCPWSTSSDFFDISFSVNLNSTGVVAPGSGCGAVIYNAMHVDASRGTESGNFPQECTGESGCSTAGCSLSSSYLGLSPNELAFEYLIFALTSCSTVVVPPPPPPLPVATTFTETIQASCPSGTAPKWGSLEWQATIPAGTNITFTAQTAVDADAGGPSTYGPAVYVGQASSTTSGWTADTCTVDGHLEDLAVFPASGTTTTQAACITGPPPGGTTPASGQQPQTSRDWLQITMTLNPSGYLVPTLDQWQQLYDCVPSE
jgi:hypothetical protein